MSTPNTPINRQAALFLSRKKRCETVQEALDGAVNHLMQGNLNKDLADVFAGDFGPEPWVSFSITVRRDAKTPSTFVYSAKTKVGHNIGDDVNLYGLKP